MFLISTAGQQVLGTLKILANPPLFKKILGIILFLVSLIILTGLDTPIEIFLLDKGLFNSNNLEIKILEIYENLNK